MHRSMLNLSKVRTLAKKITTKRFRSLNLGTQVFFKLTLLIVYAVLSNSVLILCGMTHRVYGKDEAVWCVV